MTRNRTFRLGVPSLLMLMLTAVLLVTSAAIAEPAHRRLPPVDEAGSDASFKAFRQALLAAIGKHDAAFLEQSLASDIQVGFDPDSGKGIAAFRMVWHPEKAESEIWHVLGDTLRLGGIFDADGSFSAPYVSSRFPDSLGEDAALFVVAIHSKVPMRAKPREDAAIVEKLDYDILEVPEEEATTKDASGDWLHVKTASGHQGFVRANDVRSPLDYRATFEKRGGKWVLTSFVNGD